MSDYFGYDVHFVMNITDIDDKVLRFPFRNTGQDPKIQSPPFTFTDHHTGQTRPFGPGVPSQQFGTDAPASGRNPLGVEGLHTI